MAAVAAGRMIVKSMSGYDSEWNGRSDGMGPVLAVDARRCDRAVLTGHAAAEAEYVARPAVPRPEELREGRLDPVADRVRRAMGSPPLAGTFIARSIGSFRQVSVLDVLGLVGHRVGVIGCAGGLASRRRPVAPAGRPAGIGG